MSESNKKSSERKVFMWNVVAGVVASVLVLALVEPLLRIIFEALTSTSIEFVNAYVDTLYRSAAIGTRNWVVVALGVLCVSFVIGVTAGVMVFMPPVDSENVEDTEGVVSNFNRAAGKILSSLLGKVILIAWVAVPSTGLATAMFVDLQLNSSFNQRLNALAPYIPDQQVKIFRSQWAMMKSKSDHIEINSSMNAFARHVGIELPELLLQD